VLQLKKIMTYCKHIEKNFCLLCILIRSLSDTEKESMARINNFHCGLHILVQFAEVTDKVIKQYEENTKTQEQKLILTKRCIQKR